MNLKPLSDHIVVTAVGKDEATKSGIILPDTLNKEKPEKGKVIAVGPGKRMETGQIAPLGVKIGDVVLFKKYAPDEVKIDTEEYLIISESDVLAIIE